MPGFKSFLSAAGHDFVKVFQYLGSPQGQKTIQVAEVAAVAAGTVVGGPGLGAAISGIELIINKGLKGVFNMEATAALLNAQSGTGIQKGIGVAAGLAPDVAQLLTDLGFTNPTLDQIEGIANVISKGLADIVNSIPPPPTA